ncbi:hypothetical protein [Micromonospora fulviviridis]|uniref:Uncharacterized protein n=1 Tax=Micromonospora fulviviridis TaxID=47860 RepID=A0ABV2VW88_9ACTN
MRMRRIALGLAAALALSGLAGAGVAVAAPADTAGKGVSLAVGRGNGTQPPVSKAEADQARAALVPATSAGLPPTAQSFFAVVEPTGALARGFQAVSATRLGVGTYQVVFSHDLTGSAFVATIGLSGSVGASAPGEITVVGRAGVPNGIFVQTFNSAGALTDLGFHTAVLS